MTKKPIDPAIKIIQDAANTHQRVTPQGIAKRTTVTIRTFVPAPGSLFDRLLVEAKADRHRESDPRLGMPRMSVHHFRHAREPLHASGGASAVAAARPS